MNKIVALLALSIFPIQAESNGESIFEFSEKFRQAIIDADKDFLRKIDTTGKTVAPWIMAAAFDDASAKEILGPKKRSMRSIMSDTALRVFVSEARLDSSIVETYDVYFVVPSEDRRIEISHHELGESLLVCRFNKKENDWVLPSHFCYFETGGPFE